ncbi:hypothetical protein [Paraflavitalea speifideaquila]|uniref:hypothetical protein n=1 Tax=Paraflavitalea speifideaquila TaxID=3076558 RepID=UPI0028ED788D|nr:hypothetical protein [Paraflavitalea speifideiaquila]
MDNLPTSATPIGVGYKLVNFGIHSQNPQFTQLNKAGVMTIVLAENLPYQQVWLTVDGLFRQEILVNSNLHIRIDAAKIKKEAGIEKFIHSAVEAFGRRTNAADGNAPYKNY